MENSVINFSGGRVDCCPKCHSTDRTMLGFNCFRDDETPDTWHDPRTLNGLNLSRAVE